MHGSRQDRDSRPATLRERIETAASSGYSVMSRHSYSQDQEISPFRRGIYTVRLASMYIDRVLKPGGFENIEADVEFYEDVYQRETGQSLRNARLLELGFGQRPFRLMLLRALACDVRGIDLDHPLYRLNAGAILSMLRNNGAFRAAKSLIRRVAFDSFEYRALARFVRDRHGRDLTFDDSALIVGDLSDKATWTRAGTAFDFIYSEDVFEHIPRESVPKVVTEMAEAMSPNAIAVITPMIFTGISGGHDIEWYPHRVASYAGSRGPAWGHLTGETPPGDTFLNRMTRKEFRDLFSERFDILQEQAVRGELGRQYLTDKRRQELKAFDEDELFSNNVRFVLRKKTA